MQPKINGSQENQNLKSISSNNEWWACIQKAKIWQFVMHVPGSKRRNY